MSKPDFNFEEVKKHLNTLPDNSERISYLIDIKTKYLQSSALIKLANQLKGAPFEQTFDKLCDYEIESLKEKNSFNKPEENDNDQVLTDNLPKKLVWKGTPAQFGFIIIELIGKGYLEKPTGSLKRDAKLYFDLFDIKVNESPTTPGTISKEINSKTNSLSAKNGLMLKLPNIDKLT